MRPLLRWAGSKKALIPRLRAYYPGGATRYLEAFAGSACLFFDLRPTEAILSDINRELITCYRAVKRDPELVIDALARIPRGKANYYELRSQDYARLSEPERAARFLYLNRYCFNGLFRTNRQGEFNVPYGPPKGGKWDFTGGVREASARLKGVTLLQADFATALAEARKGDFVYLDPPYVVRNRRMFAEYGVGTFSHEDLERLSNELMTLNRKGATFVVSYADSAEARALLRPWAVRRVRARRNIAGFAGHRRAAYELLATNGELK